MSTRAADFAGSWYPGTESECRDAIEEYLQSSIPYPGSETAWLGGIVPHAGWFYSGEIACHVIKCLATHSTPDTIVLFGRHLHPGSNNYIMVEGSWSTPLGELPIDRDLAKRCKSEFPFKVETATRYQQDNTIELQLPFIKYFFPDVQIVPIGIPPAAASIKIGERIADISVILGRKILILGSTDLTHYGHNYGFTPEGVGEKAVDWVKHQNDKKIIDLMLGLDADGVIRESLKNSNACCSGAAATTIAAVKKLGVKRAEKLMYRTSYDIRPDSSFVGYAGIVFGL